MVSSVKQFVNDTLKESFNSSYFFGILSSKDIENREFKSHDCFIISIPKEKKIIDGKEVEVDGEYKLKEGSIAHDGDYLVYINDEIGFTLIGNFKELEPEKSIIHTYSRNDANIGDERVIKISEFQSLICWLQKEYNITIPLNIIDE